MDKYLIYPKQFRNVKIPIEKNTCFFIMPFDESFDLIYGTLKDGLCEKYICHRADEISGSTPIINKILVEILKSQFIIVDLSDANPNVFYELGIAHTFKDAENIFLIKNKDSKAPFDITHLTYIQYDKSNLKLLVSQLKQAISENKFVSDFNEALNIRGIIDFNHENQNYEIEIIKDLISDDYQTATELLNYTCELKDIVIDKFLTNLSNKLKDKLNILEYETLKNVLNFYFEILVSANHIANIDPYLNDILNNFLLASKVTDEEKISLKTDCMIKFAKNNQKLNVVMPWIVSYFKQSRFANVDLNRYKLESLLLTTTNEDINKIICDAIFDKDSHVREHFANIIGEKNLDLGFEALIAQLKHEENYYTAGSIIEALGKLKKSSAVSYIIDWIEEHKKEIINTKSFFLYKHTYFALLRLDKFAAQKFIKTYKKYLCDL